MGYPVPSARELTDGVTSAAELAERGSLNRVSKSARQVSDEYAEFTAEMMKATIAGLTGETQWDEKHEAHGFVGNSQVAPIRHEVSRSAQVRKAQDDYEMAKSAGTTSSWGEFEKEWSLTTPVATGLVPYDLEAPVLSRAAA
jgi:hypothetical protein